MGHWQETQQKAIVQRRSYRTVPGTTAWEICSGWLQRLFKGPSSAFVGLIASTGKFCCEKGEKSCGEPTFALTTTRKPFCELFFAASYAR